jgi:hypothetical protein
MGLDEKKFMVVEIWSGEQLLDIVDFTATSITREYHTATGKKIPQGTSPWLANMVGGWVHQPT